MMFSAIGASVQNSQYANKDISDMGQRIGALKGKHMTTDQISAVSKDFESMFLSQMVESMFGESLGEEAFGSEESEDVYKGMMSQEYGKVITNAGGIGIAEYVSKELMKQQEI